MFRSLRFRLLGPLLLAALVAAGVVAVVSVSLADRLAEDELDRRYEPIQSALSDAAFPLNPTVIGTLAELTRTEWTTLDEAGDVRFSTIADASESDSSGSASVRLSEDRYILRRFKTVRPSTRTDGVWEAEVYFDRREVDASRTRALVLLMATGLSTVVGLTTATFFMSSRLIERLRRLKERVESVAHGNFQTGVSDHVNDELGQLGSAVDQMAEQLDRLWKEVRQQQGQKLLHQIAGGLAHQLRNRLTGARMAVELHVREHGQEQTSGLDVAIHEIEQSEDYVQQLLVVAAGRQGSQRPATVQSCIANVRKSLEPLARHLHVDLTWNITAAAESFVVRDAAPWISAMTNLVQNAMQAGEQVRVSLEVNHPAHLRLVVADNGPGVPNTISDQLFEPFVTTRPEGIGLGLAVVRRTAEQLDGQVSWRRENDQTIFELTISN